MFVLDLGELAYGIGGVDALSKEVDPEIPEGDGADLPINCPPGTCIVVPWLVIPLAVNEGVFFGYTPVVSPKFCAPSP